MVELLAVTAIIVVVSGVVLANNSQFGGVVVLENLAYDVALSVRQAQVYGISVARFGQDTFSAGYGISFNLSSPTTYALYADVYPGEGGNGLFEPEQSELVQLSTFNRGYRIADICTTSSLGIETCGSASRLDVLFKRPEPDAWLSVSGDSCTLSTSVCAASARVVLASPRGDVMSIVIDANGQISVRKGT